MNNTYSPLIPNDQESGSSGESLRIFDSSFNNYSLHSNPYSDYPTASKIEAFDYCWPTTTNTHNILANPRSTVIDQIQTPSSTIEPYVPVSSVNLSHIHSSTTVSATHHHHHIHQHLYPPSPTCNDPSTWLGSGDYQPLHSANNPSSFHHYSSPCSLYPANNFYDTPQSQWPSPLQPPSTMTTTAIPIKYESSYSPPPSYFESSNSLNHGQEPISKEEPSDSYQPVHYLKPQSSSSNQLNPVPARNPLNGKTRTRDKYRIVYTDQQRYELENEFVISKYISIPRKAALSLTLALSERQIKIWFQNRRAKERKMNKRRQDATSTRQLNNSNDGDSASDGGVESPNYYSNYS